MNIHLNGKPLLVDQPISLADFLQSRGIDPATGSLALALNGRIKPRAEWSQSVIYEGDRLEIVSAVQGG